MAGHRSHDLLPSALGDRGRDVPAPSTTPTPASRSASRQQQTQQSKATRALLEPGAGVSLSRTGSRSSALAGQSLRRMATHETGEYAVDDMNPECDGLDTHHEHHDHDEHDTHGHRSVFAEDSVLGDGQRHSNSKVNEKDKDETTTTRLSGNSDGDGRVVGRTRSSLDRTHVEIDVVGDGEGDADGEGQGQGEGKQATEAEAEASSPPAAPTDAKYALQDQTNLLPIKQVIIVFMGLSCALFCALLDQTIVTTALPTLGKVFNATDISSWIGTAYMLTSTSFQPLYGRLSDIFGRKIVLLVCILIFLVGTIGAAVSQTMVSLIIFRSISGIGSGGILTLSLIIIADIVTLKDRGKFQGISGGVVALANSLGPVLGGIFTETLGWRWCFYISLPMVGVALIVIFFVLPLRKVTGSATEKLRKIDYAGAVLTLVWAMLVLLALSWAGTTYAWTSAAVLAPLLIGIALGVFFVYMEAKLIPLPLMPMHIFKNRTVSASMITTFANGVAFFVTLYYLPQYLQVVRGESPLRAAVDMLPLTFIQVIFVFGSGYLVAKTGDFKYTLLFGFFVWTIGLGLMSSVGPTTPISHIYAYEVIVGIGAGPTFQTSLIAIQASVERRDMAIATGCRNFLRMLGGTVALAISGAIMNNIARSRLAGVFDSAMVTVILQAPTELVQHGLDAAQVSFVREAYAKGIQGCFYFCVPVSGISFFITLFFVDKVSLKREDEAQLKAEAKAWLEERKRAKANGGNSVVHDEEKTIGHESDGAVTVVDEAEEKK